MPSLNDLLRERTDLAARDVEWLRLLVGDWQLLSDLSFADLVLWVLAPGAPGAPRGSGDLWVALAHVRPTTGATAFVDDAVGQEVPRGRRPQLDRAFAQQRICRDRDPDWRDDVPVREEAIPVVREGRVIAVIARHTNLSTMRTPSRLELTYLDCADALTRMVADGGFPISDAPTGARRGAPRVGDGLIRLDAQGTVVYASPNAVSAFHRLGHDRELVGRSLVEVTTGLVRRRGPVDETLPLVLMGKAPWRAEVEASGTALSVRAIPLTVDGALGGALLLARDVTELRRRELELLTKDATIREIHHRVKNNLQTVAALLRLQSRRLDEGPARAALGQAERRVAAIALVHETLSTGFDETVDFDPVAARGLVAVAEVAGSGAAVGTSLTGSFGRLRAEEATSLSLVLNELVQNAVEHGLAGAAGTVTVHAARMPGSEGERLAVTVSDDGIGLGDVADVAGLGSQIVRALVVELRGEINWSGRASGGTDVRLEFVPRSLEG